VVTTGLPFQGAFSIAPGKHALDATIQSAPSSPATSVSVMIADINGNPVPDGTPVVFQSNVGSIGSSSQGGCLTTNGGCSVDFRVQSPLVPVPGQPVTPCNKAAPDSTRPGVGTVCASTTDGTNTLFKKIELFMSGNAIRHAYLGGDPTKPVSLTSTNDLGTTGSSTPLVFSLMLTDELDNSLPTGTTISLVNVANATAQVTPASVPDIAPSSAAGPQGSTHTFTITSTQLTGCKAAADASFSVAATTPSGNTTAIPFKLTFSCP
jgi:hypothetical protein